MNAALLQAAASSEHNELSSAKHEYICGVYTGVLFLIGTIKLEEQTVQRGTFCGGA
jgi:hypothetical protein